MFSASRQIFFGVSALLFLASAAFTIHLCSQTMDEMPMPGGWSMSMTWMPAENGPRAMLSFLGMWMTMMVAMMLPSLMPMLWRTRQAWNGARHVERFTVLAGTGYFLVWLALGAATFPIGVAVALWTMDCPALAQAVPAIIGVVVVLAGVFQFTAFKSRQLACCRTALPRASSTGAFAALGHGLSLGLHCAACCFNLTLLLLVAGLMDLRLMAVVTIAMAAERLAGERMARAIGVMLAVAGLFLHRPRGWDADLGF